MAQQYSAARDDLRRAFEALPQAEQDFGRTFIRRLRAEDEERMQRFERVRQIEKLADSGKGGV